MGCVLGGSAVLAVVLFALNSLGDVNDFRSEMWPGYEALYNGNLREFWSLHPAYAGALLWRTPFAISALASGAGWKGTYFLSAVPCYAAPALLGVWWACRQTTSPRARVHITSVFVVVSILDPVVWYAGILGHPEELVGGTLVIASVVSAAEGQLWLSVALMIGGLLNKPGLAEAAPVILAVSPGRRSFAALTLCLIGAGLFCLLDLTTLAYQVHMPFRTSQSTVGGGFYPSQLLWWAGGGSWVVIREHVLIVPLCVIVCVAWRGRVSSRPTSSRCSGRQALWLLAFVFLLRTSLDPWDNTYYNLPLILVFLCLDTSAGRLRGMPRWTTLSTVLALVLVPTNRILPLDATLQAICFSVCAVPALTALATASLRSEPASPKCCLTSPCPTDRRRGLAAEEECSPSVSIPSGE